MNKKHFSINKLKVYFIQSIAMLLLVSVFSLLDSSKMIWQYGIRSSAEDADIFGGMDSKSTMAAVSITESAVGVAGGALSGGVSAQNAEDSVQSNKKNKVIVIDAGHGGADTGTYSHDKSVIEKNCTLKIVKQLKKLLDGNDGIEVYYTRLEDKTVSKEKRLKLAHGKKADLFISIHCNASNWGDSSSYGIEGLYSARKYKGTSITGKKLSEKLADNVSKAVGGRDRGVRKREDLYLLGHSKVPVSIIEVGYMSSYKDLKYIKSEKGQKKIAGAIYDTIFDVLN